MDKVSVVTGEYIYADIEVDGGKTVQQLVVVRVFRSDKDGVIQENSSSELLNAEVARLTQLVNSLQSENKALRDQLSNQQVSALTAPSLGLETTSEDVPILNDGFGSSIVQATEAKERVSA